MLYFNATDLKLEVLHIFVLLFSFLVFTKCQVLHLRASRSRKPLAAKAILVKNKRNVIRRICTSRPKKKDQAQQSQTNPLRCTFHESMSPWSMVHGPCDTFVSLSVYKCFHIRPSLSGTEEPLKTPRNPGKSLQNPGILKIYLLSFLRYSLSSWKSWKLSHESGGCNARADSMSTDKRDQKIS